MPNELTDRERELAQEIADRAMIAGWENAINWASTEYGISDNSVRILLKQAADLNDKVDPSGRIEELEDYKKQLQGRSNLAARSQQKSPNPPTREREESKQKDDEKSDAA